MDSTVTFALVVMGFVFVWSVMQILEDAFKELELRSHNGILEWKYTSSSENCWEPVMCLLEVKGSESGKSYSKKLPVDVVPLKCGSKEELEAFKKRLRYNYKFQKYMSELRKEQKRRIEINEKVIY